MTDSFKKDDNTSEEQLVTIDVREEKYARKPGETKLEIYRRVAKGVSKAELPEFQEQWEEIFYQNMLNGAIGAGRIMSSAGSELEATLINCFVQPVGDSISSYDENGNPGIYIALQEAADTMRRGGGVGYNFSLLRPKNAFVNSTHSMASGPCSFINVFDTSCETVEAAGARRGAQLAALSVYHPDNLEFITAKRTPGRWNNFNVSVLIDNAFMEAKNNDEDIELYHKAKPTEKVISEGAYQRNDGMWVYKKVKAKDIWNTIMKSTYEYGEPGILFEDNINNDNNLRYVEYINTTNPCVTGDTLILTTEGYVRIDSVVEKETTIWNGFEWSDVIPKITGENQEIYDLEFSDGTKLSCTPYHKFILSDDSRIEAKDLELNNKLSKFNFPIINNGISIDEKIAYTQGFYSGDGQLGTNRIWLYNEKCNLIPYLSLSAYSDHSTIDVKRIMASVDFLLETKNFVPDINYDIKSRLNWLAGIIDSDGSVQDNAINIWSVNKNFLNKIKLMLNTLGSNGVISIGKKETFKLMPNHKGGESMYKCKDSWRLSISKSNLNILYNLGLNTHRVIINDDKGNREANRFVYLTFKQKRINLESKVYCFTDEKNHSGIFNGIMTANCGEQPLPAYGCCDLGPIILTKFVVNPFKGSAYFDYEKLAKAVGIQVRFLDNVLDVTIWPLDKQKTEAMNKRRIGVGFTGLGNALAMLNLKYNSDEGRSEAKKIVELMRDKAYEASVNLAIEKGSFPLLDVDKYLEDGTFASRLPDSIKNSIREHGIRNSHLLSVAPTGTVSLAFADNASNGIEPPFSLAYTRKKRNTDGSHTMYNVLDHSLRVYLGLIDKYKAEKVLDALKNYQDTFEYNGEIINVKSFLPESIVTALELSVEDHVLMMATVQPYIDTSISKTVNIPIDYPFESFKEVYDLSHKYNLKGISTYRPNTTLGSVLSTEKPKEEIKKEPVYIDILNTVIDRREEVELEAVAKKVTYIGPDGKDSFYLIISFLKNEVLYNDNKFEVLRPIEVFVAAHPDDVPREWIDIFARNLALLARSGINAFCKSLVDSRKVKSDKGKIRYGWHIKADGSKVAKYHDSSVACIAYAIQEVLYGKNIITEDGRPYKLEELNAIYLAKQETNNVIIDLNITENIENNGIIHGKKCNECGADAVIKKDGCLFCTNCGSVGSCG